MTATGSTVEPGSMDVSQTRLQERYEIDFSARVPQLDLPDTPAYRVRDIKSPALPMFALVCDPRLTMRVGLATTLRMLRNPLILTPQDWGSVYCPPMKRRCDVAIFENPVATPLIPSMTEAFEPWEENDIQERLLVPLLPLLRAVFAEGVTYRALRPTNILAKDGAQRIVLLGDSVTSPAAFHQPAVYETIENMMADPLGRGEGSIPDDFYALGMTILHLLCGHLPGAGVADEEMLERKIAQGSFVAVAGDKRMSSAVSELLRGLLCDEPADRWDSQEINHWVTGRRLTPTMGGTGPRAARPFELGDAVAWNLRGVARLFVRLGPEAAEAMRSPALANWMSRALGDKAFSDKYQVGILQSDDVGGAHDQHRRVARAAMMMDPAAPLRYLGVSLYPSGIGPALAWAMSTGGSVNVLAEILTARMAQFWVRVQTTSKRLDRSPQVTKDLDRIYSLLSDKRPGFGIERAVYELNPRLRCLSPLIEAENITAIEEVLPALERAVATGRIESSPLDRHISAFIARHAKRLDDKFWTGLNQNDPVIRSLSAHYILAGLQIEHGPNELPALAAFFGRQANGIISRYRNEKSKARIHAGLRDVIATGNLVRLLQFIDSAEEHRRDGEGFERARKEYLVARRNIKLCDLRRHVLRKESAETAGFVSMLLSTVLSVMVFALLMARGI